MRCSQWRVYDHQRSRGSFQSAATRSFLARLGKSDPLAPQLPTAVSHVVQGHAAPALPQWTECRTVHSLEKVLLEGIGPESVQPASPELKFEQRPGCFHDPRIHHAMCPRSWIPGDGQTAPEKPTGLRQCRPHLGWPTLGALGPAAQRRVLSSGDPPGFCCSAGSPHRPHQKGNLRVLNTRE